MLHTLLVNPRYQAEIALEHRMVPELREPEGDEQLANDLRVSGL